METAPALHWNRLYRCNRFHHLRRAALAWATLGLLAAASAAAAAVDPACKPLMDANEKQFTTPSHVYTTRTSLTGKSPTNSSSETIFYGGNSWVMVHGQWRKSPLTIKDLREHQNEQMHDGFTCRHLRDEPVGGDMTAVYGTHQISDFGPADSTIWISKASGLPVKLEMDIDLTGAMTRGGKVHQTTRYEYTNVHQPAGAQ